MRQQPYRLVFLDETSVNTKMTRLRGRSRKGQRLRMSAPFGPWKTHTFLAGLRCHELSAPWVIDGPITRRAFETYIETQLAPTLAKGDVVILDTLAAHKSAKAAACLKRNASSATGIESWFDRSMSRTGALSIVALLRSPTHGAAWTIF